MKHLIEDYHLGKLEPTDLAKFELAMKTDQTLANEVAKYRLEWEAAELMAEKLIRAQILAKFFEKPSAAPPSFWGNNWKWMASALLLLMLVGFFFFQKSSKTHPILEPAKNNLPEKITPQINPAVNPQIAETTPNLPVVPQKIKQPSNKLRQFAIAAYRIPENISGTRGGEKLDTLQMAQIAFFEKNYQKTIVLLQNLPKNDQQDALLARGHAYFLTQNFAKSSADFDLLKMGGVYNRDGEWFGLLAKLSVGTANLDNLKSSLQLIRDQKNHPFQQDAAILWKKFFEE